MFMLHFAICFRDFSALVWPIEACRTPKFVQLNLETFLFNDHMPKNAEKLRFLPIFDFDSVHQKVEQAILQIFLCVSYAKICVIEFRNFYLMTPCRKMTFFCQFLILTQCTKNWSRQSCKYFCALFRDLFLQFLGARLADWCVSHAKICVIKFKNFFI